ncbi:isochorismatase family protein [Chitinimonas lacunae]|uniref:Isochorismatase family protein n=1 Tax=Chitinimonas lacunae TaxID=1963018 RepID=A0ABV8MKN0_9NEIS
MLLQAQDSLLLVVDVQEKLVPALNDASQTVAHIKWLLEAARLAAIPVLFSEQYPQGLGSTLPCLRQMAPESPLLSKTAFSCVAAGCLEGTNLPRQVVLCGIEAHVCVLQTALDLLAAGREVFVVADAIDSRSCEDKSLALARLEAAGVTVISREMALFEWLRDAKAPAFREASRQLLQAEPRLSFAEILTTLPRIDHLAALQLWRDGRLDSVIENKPGQQGSLAIYHALHRRFGAITPKAARLGQRLYGEHADDAHLHPGKHPNIDRLFALETMGGGYGVRLISH